MNDQLLNIFENMRSLGLAALSHANKLYSNIDKGGELSVLKAAHAAEILIKARIAEEHPLLIFKSFPKTQNDDLSLDLLFDEGYTYEWNKLPDILWATTGKFINKKEEFQKFGKLRNGIQHFGAMPEQYVNSTTAQIETTKFIYSIIQPLIFDWWNIKTIEYCEDYIDPEYIESSDDNNLYWQYVRYLIIEQVDFIPSDYIKQNVDIISNIINSENVDILYKNKLMESIL